MHYATTVLVAAAGLLAPPVVATDGGRLWGKGGEAYCAPAHDPPKCSPEQQQAYTFQDVPQGPLNAYDQLSCTGGWTIGAGNPSFGTRAIRGRSGGGTSNCAQAPLKNNPSYAHPDTMSPATYHIAASQAGTNFTAVYDVGNGATCTQDHSCGPDGAVVTNHQCGKAKSVTFKPKKGSEDCTISIHTMSFHCSTQGQSSAPTATASSDAQSSASSAPTASTSQPSSYAQSSPAGSSGYPHSSAPEYSTSKPTASTSESSSYSQSSPAGSSGYPHSSAPEYSTSKPTASTTGGEYPHSSAPEYSTSKPTASTSESSYSQSSPAGSSGYPHSSAPEYSTSKPTASTSESSSYSQSSPAGSSGYPHSSAPEYSTSKPTASTSESSYSQSSPAGSSGYPHSSAPEYSTSTPAASTTGGEYPHSSAPEYSTSKPTASTSQSTYPESSAPPASSGYPHSSAPEYSTSKPAASTSESSYSKSSYSQSSPPESSSTKPESSATGGQYPHSSPPEYSTSKPTASLTTSTIYTTSYQTVTSCAPSVKDCPAESHSTYVITSTIAVSTTVCPVTATSETSKPSDSGSSYSQSKPADKPTGYTTEKPSDKPSGYPTDKPGKPSKSSEQPPVATPAQCPAQVPMCLNAHLEMVGGDCKDNTDMNCYCIKPEFTKQVMDCFDAYSNDDATKAQAYSCFAGICAPHLGSNPGPIAGIPSSITYAPAPSATYPHTTVSVSTVMTVPCTYSSGPSAGQPIPSSSTVQTVNTVATVPQVGFSTAEATAGATPAPQLYQGTPANNEATTTDSTSDAGAPAPSAGSGDSGSSPSATGSSDILTGAASAHRAPALVAFGAIVLSALLL